MLESLLIKTFECATLLKRESNTGVFPVNIAKFLRAPILKNFVTDSRVIKNKMLQFCKLIYRKLSIL